MAKDPAVNWYFDNWDGGTKLFTRHQKGCYMDLLSAQFHSGPLSLENIKTVLGSDYQASWPVVSKKFEEKDGFFFNERLEAERKKRIAYSESRRINRTKKDMTNISNTHLKHMNKIPGTEIGAEIENWDSIKLNFFNDWKWKEKFCLDKKISLPVLEAKMKQFISDTELREDYKDLKEIKKHFVNTYNKMNGIAPAPVEVSEVIEKVWKSSEKPPETEIDKEKIEKEYQEFLQTDLGKQLKPKL